ncbi:hypothetical protein [Cellulophaga tyrosinoxydans]|uniref:Lipocalin-like domain-containing protein n=1 Tax=Cellulophaga tyrosinoxydans TaxID=504486 RepID=A0A1W2CMU6_9FLAO|nr:hypothetical protein [Cellulophaga tyrosinoxydans]SMC86346.1 hypothetical protein SAMN05660703_3078 [Cellulophaga tyrosinoxydans]
MKLRILLILFFGINVLSCTNKNSEEEFKTKSELLSEKSPWVYSHYELLEIIDSYGSELTEVEIENINNEENEGWTVSFNTDGTGYSKSPSNITNEWKWKIDTNENLVFIHPNDTTTYADWNVNSSQLYIAFESITYDEQIKVEVLHLGKNVFE